MSPQSNGKSLLWKELRATLAAQDYRRRAVHLLLGSDEAIPHEARVALTPDHVSQLRSELETAGLEPRIFVLSGAGLRARREGLEGFADEAYAEVGGEIVGLDEIAGLPPLDLVHALKEPTEYESRLPGPFLRLGALHLASKPPGVCQLLRSKNFAAILDGGTIGNCSYLRVGGDRTPIVGSMSRFAGAVAGRKLRQGLRENDIAGGRVVVVGGGIAGTSAIQELDPSRTELVVVETYAPTKERLEGYLPTLGFENFSIAEAVTDELLRDAVGIIFAHRSGAKAAEKVCSFEQIRGMRKGGAVVDIAIDQGGSIYHADYREEDDVTTSRRKYQAILGDYFYYAETNMPREEPREASKLHGDASLPYLATLLAYCAHTGSPGAVVQAILEHPRRIYGSASEIEGLDLLGCLVRDLRNGLQIITRGGKVQIVDDDIRHDAPLMAWISDCEGTGG